MIHHLCLITYTDPSWVDDETQAAIDAAYAKLPALIPGIVSLKAGRDEAHMEIIYPVLGPYMASYETAQFES